MESLPQNPDFRINPENFHPCICIILKACSSMGYYGWVLGFISFGLSTQDRRIGFLVLLVMHLQMFLVE